MRSVGIILIVVMVAVFILWTAKLVCDEIGFCEGGYHVDEGGWLRK